jgi:hypothetical protein
VHTVNWKDYWIEFSYLIMMMMMMANKCLKHVEAINRNKLKANNASYWSYYTYTDQLFTSIPLIIYLLNYLQIYLT